ncbi:hypothetical protein HN51_019658, partial [Arachis hypogaea]
AIKELEQQWYEIILKYNLQYNKHLKESYQIRKNWVLAHHRDYFFEGMTPTERLKSINTFVKRFVSFH